MKTVALPTVVAAMLTFSAPAARNRAPIPTCVNLEHYGEYRSWESHELAGLDTPQRICVGKGRVLVLLESGAPAVEVMGEQEAPNLRAVVVSLDPSTLAVQGTLEVPIKPYHKVYFVCPDESRQYLLADDELRPIASGPALENPMPNLLPVTHGLAAAIGGDILAEVYYLGKEDVLQVRSLPTDALLLEHHFPISPHSTSDLDLAGTSDRIFTPIVVPATKSVLVPHVIGKGTALYTIGSDSVRYIGAWPPIAACGQRAYWPNPFIPLFFKWSDTRTGDEFKVTTKGLPSHIMALSVTCSASNLMLLTARFKRGFLFFGGGGFQEYRAYRYDPRAPEGSRFTASPVTLPMRNGGYDYTNYMFGLAYDPVSGASFALNGSQVCRIPPF